MRFNGVLVVLTKWGGYGAPGLRWGSDRLRRWGAVFAVGVVAWGVSLTVRAGEAERSGLDGEAVTPNLGVGEEAGVSWATGEGVTFGGVLFPHFHAAGVFGGTTADSISGLASGHHDPQSDATLQSLEPGVSLRLGGHVEGFATYSAYSDADGEVDGGWEEAFLKLVELPGGFELRGGRFLNRFGFQNAQHNHAWNFVNQHLVNGRLLQEGEVATIGGEVTWNLPMAFRSALSVSLGEPPDHDGHDHDAHGHDGGEADFEGEEARFDDYVAGVNFLAGFDWNDFHRHRMTASAAWGENTFGRTTQLYGLGYEHLWRERGFEPGGRFFRWRTELVYRTFGAVGGGAHDGEHGDEDEPHDEDAHEDDHDDEARRATFDDFGVYSLIQYGFNDRVEAGLRAGWIGALDELGLDERFRLSPALTFSLNRARTAYLRLQYDFDHSPQHGGDHSAWVQVGLNWGGAHHHDHREACDDDASHAHFH